jgi:cardiolipin synthase A/B
MPEPITKTSVSGVPSAKVGAYPIREGNYVRPLVDGGPAFERICEAVDAAQHSVWVTVAFLSDDFQMPGGRGSLFDVLDGAKARGVDVRVIFWRPAEEFWDSDHGIFPGTSEQLEMLAARGSTFLARWDRAQKRYCQHQKSWTIDAGREGEVAFVGGINLNNPSVVSPGHAGGSDAHTHDVYIEVRGPAATDIHHNFVQRWNEASETSSQNGTWPHVSLQSGLEFPDQLTSPCGPDLVQIQRTVKAGHYTDETATPGGAPFAVADGEFSIYEQYLSAINAARNSIYIEDQAIGAPDIVEALHEALARGVDVTVLVPADANEEMAAGRKLPQAKPFFDRLGELGNYENFLLAGIAVRGDDGVLRNIYVHAKIMLVDDHWTTIGSCNIGNRSFFNDTELNASVWSEKVVRQLRCDLLEEHLSIDTRDLDDKAAMAKYREIARKNSSIRARGERLTSLAYALDPATYPE